MERWATAAHDIGAMPLMGLMGFLFVVALMSPAWGTGTTDVAGRSNAPAPASPSPYVRADSAAEAKQILSELRSGEPVSAGTASSVKYGPCVLYPSALYLRTSL